MSKWISFKEKCDLPDVSLCFWAKVSRKCQCQFILSIDINKTDRYCICTFGESSGPDISTISLWKLRCNEFSLMCSQDSIQYGMCLSKVSEVSVLTANYFNCLLWNFRSHQLHLCFVCLAHDDMLTGNSKVVNMVNIIPAKQHVSIIVVSTWAC